MAFRWYDNMINRNDTGPLVIPALFQAGATQAITKGQMLERTADTNTRWVPLDSDFDMTTVTDGGLVIAACDIASGDPAGYYPVWVPRPGDRWIFDKAATGADALGTALYFSSATALTITAGTNIIATISGYSEQYPSFQNRLSKGVVGDEGEALVSVADAVCSFRNAVSHFARLQRA